VLDPEAEGDGEQREQQHRHGLAVAVVQEGVAPGDVASLTRAQSDVAAQVARGEGGDLPFEQGGAGLLVQLDHDFLGLLHDRGRSGLVRVEAMAHGLLEVPATGLVDGGATGADAAHQPVPVVPLEDDHVVDAASVLVAVGEVVDVASAVVPERALAEGEIRTVLLPDAVEGLGGGDDDRVREQVGSEGEKAARDHDREGRGQGRDAAGLEGEGLAVPGGAPERHEAAEERGGRQQVLEQIAGADLEEQRGDAVLGLEDLLHVEQDLDHQDEQDQHDQDEEE
jgi:hypothetical protein